MPAPCQQQRQSGVQSVGKRGREGPLRVNPNGAAVQHSEHRCIFPPSALDTGRFSPTDGRGPPGLGKQDEPRRGDKARNLSHGENNGSPRQATTHRQRLQYTKAE